MVKSPVENCVFDHTWSILDERLLEASREAILEAEEKVREVSQDQKEVACKHCQKVIGQFVPDPESLTVATSYISCVFCPGKMFIQTPLGHRLNIFKDEKSQLSKVMILARRLDNDMYDEFFTRIINSENITEDIFAEQILRIMKK